MDGYPHHYVAHNLPFVVLFGLESTEINPQDEVEKTYPLLREKGIYISSDLPNVAGPPAESILSCFRDVDARDAAWNNRPGKGKVGTMGFTYRTVGRAFTLPPRKANPPSSLDSPLVAAQVEGGRKGSSTPTLHSPLSPLTPGSPTFPDGIMTPLWFSKHQWLLPSAIISFFNFTLDRNSSTLQDNKLKTEINALRTSITASSYKFRLIVILVADDHGTEIGSSDRIANIRRGTNLDSKSLFFLPRGPSDMELRKFVGMVLSSIQPTCMEYYRELSKHARKKRSRGSIPPPTAPPTTGTSQTLSSQGWNVRYETKLGFFAESRQEMDAAGQSYEAAYEYLVDGDVFEGIASWSPRFDEGRLLADILAIRILRCLLWTGQTTSAVQSWTNHRYRMQEIIDKKGKGTSTYGWQAWEARWSVVMAELIERVDVPIFHVPEHPKATEQTKYEVPDIYAIPEKAFANEPRLPPWDLLHHEGYWLERAVHRTQLRRRLALTMPKEDRSVPGQSPASAIASRTHLYDSYLCPEPHFEYALPGNDSFDHGALLVNILQKSAHHFSLRHQHRAVQRAQHVMAMEHTKYRRWEEAMAIVKPLWHNLTWRHSGWWQLVEEVSWTMRACARNLDDGESLVAVEWELLSDSLPARPNWNYNLLNCLDGLEIDKPVVVIEFDNLAPCMSAFFAFNSMVGNVGVPVTGQLSITSHARKSTAPIVLSEVELMFEGGLRGVKISHHPDTEFSSTTANGVTNFIELPLSDLGSPSEISSPTASTKLQGLCGSAELSFDPGVTKVFSLTMLPRDAGQVQAIKACLKIRQEAFDPDVSTSFDLDVNIPLRNSPSRVDWWQPTELGLERKRLDIENHCSLEVLAKPPKLEIRLPNLRKTYYTDEKIDLIIQFVNGEDDVADVKLSAHCTGQIEQLPTLSWSSLLKDGDETEMENKVEPPGTQHEYSLGKLGLSESKEETLSFNALPIMFEFVIEIKANYVLLADPETNIFKTFRETISFIGPFEANYEYIPSIHPDPWPSYFHVDTIAATTEEPSGLRQSWTLATKIASFGLEALTIQSVSLQILDTKYGATCKLLESPNPIDNPRTLYPNELTNLSFPLDIQKSTLEDKRASTVNSRLDIVWTRSSSLDSTATTTTLFVPPLTVPFGEPRCLASSYLLSSVSPTPSDLATSLANSSVIHLTYIIENPSLHVLTFSSVMEASEEFAFTGPKSMQTTLVPLSRREIKFNLLPTRLGVWIRPVLKVTDIGFGKVLKVMPAQGCRGDKKERGVLIWAEVGDE